MRRGLGRVPARQPVTRGGVLRLRQTIARGTRAMGRDGTSSAACTFSAGGRGRCSRQQADAVTALHTSIPQPDAPALLPAAVAALGSQAQAPSPTVLNQRRQGLPAVQGRGGGGSVAIGIRKANAHLRAGATSDSARNFGVPPGLAQPAGWRLAAPWRVAPAMDASTFCAACCVIRQQVLAPCLRVGRQWHQGGAGRRGCSAGALQSHCANPMKWRPGGQGALAGAARVFGCLAALERRGELSCAPAQAFHAALYWFTNSLWPGWEASCAPVSLGGAGKFSSHGEQPRRAISAPPRGRSHRQGCLAASGGCHSSHSSRGRALGRVPTFHTQRPGAGPGWLSINAGRVGAKSIARWVRRAITGPMATADSAIPAGGAAPGGAGLLQ